MILIDATIKYKSYSPLDLTKGSHKRVCRSCDDCGRISWVEFKSNYHNLCNSCAKSGKNNSNLGKSMSDETKFKISLGNTGKIRSDKVKFEMSKNRSGENHWAYGIHRSEKSKIKSSCTQRNIKIKDFDKFKSRNHLISINRCIQLNNKIKNFDGHHITSGVIIYLPKNIHKSIRHNMKDGKGMDKINGLAFNYLINGL